LEDIAQRNFKHQDYSVEYTVHGRHVAAKTSADTLTLTFHAAPNSLLVFQGEAARDIEAQIQAAG
jgi:hypothetical protein